MSPAPAAPSLTLLFPVLRSIRRERFVETKTLSGFVSQNALPRSALAAGPAFGRSRVGYWLMPNPERQVTCSAFVPAAGISPRSGFVLLTLLLGLFPGFGPPDESGLPGTGAPLLRGEVRGPSLPALGATHFPQCHRVRILLSHLYRVLCLNGWRKCNPKKSLDNA